MSECICGHGMCTRIGVHITDHTELYGQLTLSTLDGKRTLGLCNRIIYRQLLVSRLDKRPQWIFLLFYIFFLMEANGADYDVNARRRLREGVLLCIYS